MKQSNYDKQLQKIEAIGELLDANMRKGRILMSQLLKADFELLQIVMKPVIDHPKQESGKSKHIRRKYHDNRH